MDFQIDPDIRAAAGPPASLYCDPRAFDLQVERVLARSWHALPDAARASAPGSVVPTTLLPGTLDEPLIVSRDLEGDLHAFSNVCTHRGALLVEGATQASASAIRCRYHGRRFGLDGRFLSMPGFEDACDFPSASDDLPSVPLEAWGPLTFTSLAPAFSFEEWTAPLRLRLDWLGFGALRFDADASRDYELAAHWALYCDNYLEGLHVPYVHPSLNGTLDLASYRTELHDWASIQVAAAAEGEVAFDLPAGHPDEGQRIAAYYAFLFPTTMLNFYPWGISVNLVLPLAPDRTRVRFLSFVRDASLREMGAGGPLHEVELEDESVVASVQRGLHARLRGRGRYAPRHEQGLHHFHRLLAQLLRG